MRVQFFLLLFSLLFLSLSFSDNKSFSKIEINTAHSFSHKNSWTDSILHNMTLRQRIGQLFMVAAYSNKFTGHTRKLEQLITEYNIGGLIFMQGGPIRQVTLTNHYQSQAKIPLLIATDAEWGLSMRLDSTITFPRQLMLGAVKDNQYIYEMGKEIGRQCKRIGVHINFAPVVDINNNPDNPVINDRSFGENIRNVSEKGIAYMRGLQEAGVIACAKHFPGHGDTDKDSHKTLPVIKHSKKRLDSVELSPFRDIIKAGVGSIMTAHLYIPSLDSDKNQASSLSQKVVTHLLREKMNFKGLIVTDALNMKGVSKYNTPSKVVLKALLAGNDILLFPENVPEAITEIENAITTGIIPQSAIDMHVKRILSAKYDAGLHNYKTIKTKNLIKELNTSEAILLKRQLIENSLTLLSNKDSLIPFKLLDTLNFASLSIGADTITTFQEYLSNYAPIDHYQVKDIKSKESLSQIIAVLSQYNTIIIGLHNMSRYASQNYGLSKNMLWFIDELNKHTKVILTVFGNPYSVKYFDQLNWLLVSYDNDHLTQSLSAQLLFGGISANGRLPISASRKLDFGKGLNTLTPCRLKYTIPEEAGINETHLYQIDTIAWEAIDKKATPGCQILIAKQGKVIFKKSYGYHTYDKKRRVENNDLYDIASITKIAATTISLMRLYDLNILKTRKKLEDYLPGLDETNKNKLVIRDILTHQSGLKDWIPFYQYTIKKDGTLDSNYSQKQDSLFTIHVAKGLYLNKNYPAAMWQQILQSRIRNKGQYRYSDLGYYFFKRIIEDINQQPLDQYIYENFYTPLGLSVMGYNPIERFPLEQIVPTENDNIFRKQLIHGYVHDPGASMLGGIGGHAGLFSNTNDLAILFQMLLQNGTYGGDQYFKKATVKTFSSKQFRKNRRGLGFDKPELNPNKIGPTSEGASPKTFGHSGFTGCCVWADPEYELIYIFLSNRIHPDSKNRKLIDLDIRTRIQQVIYDAILENK